jgi:dihydroorotate dehydrogenase (NAD+) catalytic subunit
VTATAQLTDDVDLTVRLGGIELPNPIIAASGTFGLGVELARLCPPRELGAVTVKSLAPFPWEGNPPLRTTETAGGGMLNSVGLTGPGLPAWLRDHLPALSATGARIIVSLWGHTVDDFECGARLVAAHAEAADSIVAVELNLSCPNLDAARHMFAVDAAATSAAVSAVTRALDPLPVFTKLTAAVGDLVAIARAATDAGAAGLTLINTMPGLALDATTRRPVLGAANGGVSGPPLKAIALRAVADCAAALPAVPIIGTGGVTGGRDAVELLLAGASGVGVGTATFADPRATLRIRDELAGWCRVQGVAQAAELVGAARPAGQAPLTGRTERP